MKTAKLTEEHLIPKSLGGRLTCYFVCAACNSQLGHAVEADANNDPTVRLLATKLESSFPHLANSFSDKQPFFSTGPGGKSRGQIKNGEFVVQSRKLNDGSLIQPTAVAAKSLRQMLKRDNHDEAGIAEALRIFEVAPENTKVALSDKIEVVKWSIEAIQPALDGPFMNPIVPIKSAYEFLALHLGNTIYEDSPPLATIREVLFGANLNERYVQVERLQAADTKPFHGIVFEGNNPYAVVQLRLFGQLAFRVHFKTLSIAGPRFAYTHDLTDNLEHVELVAND